MKKTCIFDLDDTLADLKEPLCNALNKRTGKNMHWSEWSKFNVENYYGLKPEDLLNVIIEDKLLENLTPHEGTRELLTDLTERKYDIKIITSREYHPNALKVTKQWFTKYDIPYTNIVISAHGKKKSDYVNKEENVALFLDDRIENVMEFMQSCKSQFTFLYEMPWNSDSLLLKINNLNQVRPLLNM